MDLARETVGMSIPNEVGFEKVFLSANIGKFR